MKTIKQIADEIGIDKQRVYRYIRKNNISESHQDAGVMYYDETAETLIKSNLAKYAVSDDVNQSTSESYQNSITESLIDMLKLDLEFKNRQISEQQETIHDLTLIISTKDNQIFELTTSLNAAQALHAGTIHKQLTDNMAVKEENAAPPPEPMARRKSWWMFWR